MWVGAARTTSGTYTQPAAPPPVRPWPARPHAAVRPAPQQAPGHDLSARVPPQGHGDVFCITERERPVDRLDLRAALHHHIERVATVRQGHAGVDGRRRAPGRVVPRTTPRAPRLLPSAYRRPRQLDARHRPASSSRRSGWCSWGTVGGTMNPATGGAGEEQEGGEAPRDGVGDRHLRKGEPLKPSGGGGGGGGGGGKKKKKNPCPPPPPPPSGRSAFPRGARHPRRPSTRGSPRHRAQIIQINDLADHVVRGVGVHDPGGDPGDEAEEQDRGHHRKRAEEPPRDGRQPWGSRTEVK